MDASLLLILDLGDALTKGMAVGPGRAKRLRFPSAVAHRLLRGEAETAELLLEGQEPWPRPADFDPRDYPRTRSYPGGDAFLREVYSEEHPVSGARFAGWLAAAHGADRQLLGTHPTAENIDALVRKAFLLSAADCRSAELVFVLDVGAKAEAIQRYAEAPERAVAFEAWSFVRSKPGRTELSVRGHVIDAADCAAAALPPEVSVPQVGRVLLLDIGYLRTKLAIVSGEGCEHQEHLDGLGVADCVRRILRDGQDQGLVEDEFAVIGALEQSDTIIEVAGRRFDIKSTLESARRGLEEELARAAERAVVGQSERRGEMCRAAAIFGGGAAIAGQGIAARLRASDLGLDPVWVTTDTSFFLVEGARRTHERQS